MQNTIIKDYKVYLQAVKHLQKGTVSNRVLEISKFLLFVGPVNDFKPLETVDFNQYFAHRYTGRNYKRSYTNNIVCFLKDFYNYLFESGFIVNNPAVLIDKSSPEESLPDILTMEEYHMLLKQFGSNTKDIRDLALIETLFSTGMRISECLSIRTDQLGLGGVSIVGKGNSQRLKIINPAASKTINAWLKVRPTGCYLFCNMKGSPLSRVYVNAMIKAKCCKAGITKQISAHSFRHFFATILLEGGANLFEVSNLLGHESVKSTEIYTKISVNHLRDEMRHHPRW